MHLRIGLGKYDRTAAVCDGTVHVAGADFTVETPPLEELFVRAFDRQEFDVAELSFSNYVYLSSVGKCGYLALPVFPSRTFRHSAVYVHAGKNIRSPRDLIGRLVGVREYSMTAALMVRGLLEDDFGVMASAIDWLCGRVDPDEPAPVLRMMPRGVRVASIDGDANLSDMLERGEIDALVSYKPPSCFRRGVPHVCRLFPDHVSAERDYYARTGIFPIMHLVAVKRELADRDPALCVALCDAFEQARRLAFNALASHSTLAVALPWALDNFTEAKNLMGQDYWPYGVSANGAAIQAVARYSAAQGLAARELGINEMFVRGTLDWDPTRTTGLAPASH